MPAPSGFRMELETVEFNKVLEEYVKWQKRTPADIINAKLFFIARNATMTTKASTPGDIEAELKGASKEYPESMLAYVIVNSQLRNAGKAGVGGAAMAKAVEKLIKKRRSSVNFIRSGWKNAILMLEDYMRSKGELTFVRRWQNQAPVNRETMKKKNFKYLGKATPARIERSPKVWGEIQNDAHGKDTPGSLTRLEQVKQSGLQEAVNKEVRSMIQYIERKLNPKHAEVSRKLAGHQ